jgi:hypothetical protein
MESNTKSHFHNLVTDEVDGKNIFIFYFKIINMPGFVFQRAYTTFGSVFIGRLQYILIRTS